MSQRLGCQGPEKFDCKFHNQVLIRVQSSVLDLQSRLEKENTKCETRAWSWRTDCIQAEIILSVFFFNIFIVIQSTYHEIYPFKV